jgi:hypothetical protein
MRNSVGWKCDHRRQFGDSAALIAGAREFYVDVAGGARRRSRDVLATVSGDQRDRILRRPGQGNCALISTCAVPLFEHRLSDSRSNIHLPSPNTNAMAEAVDATPSTRCPLRPRRAPARWCIRRTPGHRLVTWANRKSSLWAPHILSQQTGLGPVMRTRSGHPPSLHFFLAGRWPTSLRLTESACPIVADFLRNSCGYCFVPVTCRKPRSVPRGEREVGRRPRVRTEAST